ncbi:DNA-directed RNA polymerase V subunit 7 [Curcuma longa]|uniref:DNA-directed RNA polymerase V subunit 7 n=1 Tax=Curcuma longa TaxID=136217 RepID=UPI003D9F86F2
MVFMEVDLSWNVIISPEQLDAKGLLLHKAIILRLMDDIASRKASKEHGYYVAVTTLNSVGEGKVRELSGDVLFPVTFTCITLKPIKGDILVGTVDKILKHGIFLKAGPIGSIFLSEKTMRDYKYVGGDNPMFLNDKHANLEKDTMIRFKVLGLKWLESDREFQVLATLAGDFLGSL